MDQPVLVYTTWPNTDAAEVMGRRIVEKRLAACVNIIPGMTSIFHWNGKIEASAEILMIVKTRRGRLNETMATIEANHAYKTASILAVPVLAADPAYARWIEEETGG